MAKTWVRMAKNGFELIYLLLEPIDKEAERILGIKIKTPHRENVLELGGVGGEQRDVEHALGYRLLGRVPVGVQLGLQQRGWLGGITSGEQGRVTMVKAK